MTQTLKKSVLAMGEELAIPPPVPPIQTMKQIGDFNMMTRKVIPIAMSAIGLMGAIAPAAIGMMNYGTGEPLTQQQSNILTRREMAWPQSYPAVISKFGYPNQRDERADYYDLADGRKVAIVYEGATAVAAEGL